MSLPRALPEPTHTPLRGGPVLRWGILGPGQIANDWVETVQANTDQRIIAVGSRSLERAERFAAAHGIPRWYGSYEHFVEDPDVDIVYIAAPHSEHRRLAELAISAGKHVLIEKPIATSAHEAELIADAARAAGVFAMEAMWSRFLPQTTIIAKLLEDGVLGELHGATADFGSDFPFDASSRIFNPALGGGGLLDLGVYTLWFTTFALGDPISIATRGRLASTGVDDEAVVDLTFSNGARGISFTSISTATSVEGLITGDAARIAVETPFIAPGGFRLEAEGEALTWQDETDLRWRGGLCYVAPAVAAHIAAGRLEAPEHPLAASERVMRLIDTARAQLGAA